MTYENLYDLLKECTENLYAIADRLSYGESSKHPTVAEEIRIAGDNANEAFNGMSEALNGIKDDLDEVSEKLDDLNDNISKIADALERMVT